MEKQPREQHVSFQAFTNNNNKKHTTVQKFGGDRMFLSPLCSPKL